MADVVNDRVNEAQAILKERAERLNRLVNKTKGKKLSAQFAEGVRLVSDLIKGESEIIDALVFDAPETYLEQMRNLQLATGGPSEKPAEHLKNATDAIDTMLETLEGMAR